MSGRIDFNSPEWRQTVVNANKHFQFQRQYEYLQQQSAAIQSSQRLAEQQIAQRANDIRWSDATVRGDSATAQRYQTPHWAQKNPSGQTAQATRIGGASNANVNAGRTDRIPRAPRPTVRVPNSPRTNFASSPAIRGAGGAGLGAAIVAGVQIAAGADAKTIVASTGGSIAGGAIGGILGGMLGSAVPGIGTATGAGLGASLGSGIGGLLGQMLFPWQEPAGEIPGNGLGQETPLDPTYPGALNQDGQPLDLPIYPEDGTDPGFPPVNNPNTGEPGTTWELEYRITTWDDRTGVGYFPTVSLDNPLGWGTVSGTGPFYGTQLVTPAVSQGGVPFYRGVAIYADAVYVPGSYGSSSSFGGATAVQIRNLKIDGVPTPLGLLNRPQPAPIPAPISRPRGAPMALLPPLPQSPPKPSPAPKPDLRNEPELKPQKAPRPNGNPLPGAPFAEPDPDFEYVPGPFGDEFGNDWAETGRYTSPSGNVTVVDRQSPDGTTWRQTQIVEPKTGQSTVGLPQIIGNAAGLSLAGYGLATGLGALGKRYQIRQAMPNGAGVTKPQTSPSPILPPTAPPPTVAKPKCPCSDLSNNSSNPFDDALLRKIDATTTANLAVSTANGLGINANGQAIGVGAFPASVPGNLANPGSGTRQLNNLASMHLWQTEQLDGLLGQFPNSLTVETPDGQQVNVSQPNVSESLAEIQGMLISLMVSNSEILHTSTRTLQQAGSATQQAFLSNQIARANADFLGYSAIQDAREIPLAYNPGGQPFQNLLGTGTANVRGFRNNDQQDLKSILYELLHAAAIIRAVYWRQIDPGSDIGSQIRQNSSNVPSESGQNDWLEYLRRVERDFGAGEAKPGQPRIVNHDDGLV